MTQVDTAISHTADAIERRFGCDPRYLPKVAALWDGTSSVFDGNQSGEIPTPG